MSKGREELGELEVQEVRMRVQLDKAKSLISSWMGDSSSEDEDQAELALPRINKGSGLGAVSKKAATSLALEKLRKQQTKPKHVQPQPPNSDSEEEFSRASLTKRGAARSAFDMHKKKQKKK